MTSHISLENARRNLIVATTSLGLHASAVMRDRQGRATAPEISVAQACALLDGACKVTAAKRGSVGSVGGLPKKSRASLAAAADRYNTRSQGSSPASNSTMSKRTVLRSIVEKSNARRG